MLFAWARQCVYGINRSVFLFLESSSLHISYSILIHGLMANWRVFLCFNGVEEDDVQYKPLFWILRVKVIY